MPPLLWFLVGAATAIAATFFVGLLRRRLGRDAAQQEQTDGDALDAGERIELALARRVLDETTRDLESLATGLGNELATMASAIDGHAQLLCEAIGDPQRVVRRADHLWTSVRRLRMFSEKILSFAQVEALPLERIEVRALLNGIAQEIEDSGNRITVTVSTAEFLPPVVANERALRNATQFLVDTLLRIETRASRLELRAYAEVFDDQDTRVQIEICAEAEDAGPPHEPTDHAVHLGYIAARNLLDSQNARLSFDEVEGLSVACFLSLPIAQDEPALPPPEATSPPAVAPHHFGGALVLESDPEIRALIAHELKACGRKIVSCVDGASARSLLAATPERFELAILDADARIESGASIARLALESIDGIRILLLTSTPARIDELAQRPDVRVVTKPFGVPEIREALAELLDAAPAAAPAEP